MFKFFWLNLLLVVPQVFFAQNIVEKHKNYFGSPLEIPLLLSGNFAELRSNHFHTGIDLKTQGKVGQKVFAAADGKVIRIKISPYGYGKTIYIEHPNGLTTVYAHLKSFEPYLADIIRKIQYTKKSFEIDEDFSTKNIYYKKGDLIALSGNSGSSGGPHLHFEIRETVTQNPLNPLKFNFQVKDNIYPIIKSIAFIPMDKNSFINNENKIFELEIFGANGLYMPKYKDNILLSGSVGIAINTHDLLNGSNNVCGVSNIKYWVDSTLVFQMDIDKLDYDTQRYINAHTLYEKRIGANYHKCFVEPNNELDFYTILQSNGIINFEDERLRKLDFQVMDIFGNQSSVSIDVQCTDNKPLVGVGGNTLMKHATMVNWETGSSFIKDGISVMIPKKAFYKNENIVVINYPAGSTKNNALGRFILGDKNIGVHHNIEITVPVDISLVQNSDKLLVARVIDSEKYSSEGGIYKNGKISFKTKNLGEFIILLDTIAPRVSTHYFPENIKGISAFSLTISDNLSGIKHIKPSINGKWVLYDYDPKLNRLTFDIDSENFGLKEENLFELQVTDERGNSTNFSKSFTY